MPPLHASLRALSLTSKAIPSSPVLVLPTQQTRHASILSSLTNVPTSYNKRIRRGRGPASGKGKTSGRGHKGQKQHGKVPAGFQGGQTPAEVIHGKRGMQSNVFAPDYATLNVDRLQFWIDQGRIDPAGVITVQELCRTRCLHGAREGVKLLARNADSIHTPMHIVVSRASASAIAAIEKAGGSVQTRYYTKSSIGRIMRGQTHPFLSNLSPAILTPQPAPSGSATSREYPTTEPDVASSGASAPTLLDPIFASHPPPSAFKYRLPDAYSRKDLEYYRDPAHRGYLAHQVQEGAGPSLFFKSPEQLREQAKQRRREKKAAAEGQTGTAEERIETGRIW